MKKKILTIGLALCMAMSLLLPCASAADTQSTELKTILALEIMVGDSSGNLNLDGNVTRAQFVTLMTKASAYKDDIASGGSGYSLFKDVKSSYWASEYIKLAVDQKWVSGYTDGTFRPGKDITLESACTIALKLLGYDTSALAGSFPTAQLTKASSLGLRDNLDAKKGDSLTRGECVTLIYNMLNAKTAQGQVYAQTLGYTVTDGTIDYTAVIKDKFKGPFIASAGEKLSFTPKTIYRNGESSTDATLSENDVYYYNKATSSLWIYDKKAVGKITAIMPSSESPTSVTISGVTYTLGTSEVQYDLSVQGGVSKGDVVTLLLGVDDEVVGVVTGNAVDKNYYGVVVSSSKSAASDSASVETTVNMICTDGVSRTFTVAKDTSYTTGRLIRVDVSDAGTSVSTLTERGISGRVDTKGEKFGNYTFAENVEILDTTTEGDAVAIEPERLAGITLDEDDVRTYVLNESGQIETLILKDVTGDVWSYGYLEEATQTDMGQLQFTVSYQYMMDGRAGAMTTQNIAYPVQGSAGFAVKYNADGTVKTMRQLTSVSISSLGSTTAQTDNKRYTLADEVQVYFKQNDAFYSTTLSNVNTTDYTLTGWYDNFGCTAGGQIRVIIAIKK